jgi:hypothetical protein
MKKSRTRLLTLLGALGIVGGIIGAIAYSAHNSQIQLVMVQDGIWGRTELSIFIAPDNTSHATFTSFGRIGYSDRGTIATTRRLSIVAADVERMRDLSERSDLFTGQVWGEDPRGLDSALVTLQFSEDLKIVTLTCTGNETFNSGVRKELVSLLKSLADKAYETPLSPNKPLQPIAPKDGAPAER